MPDNEPNIIEISGLRWARIEPGDDVQTWEFCGDPAIRVRFCRQGRRMRATVYCSRRPEEEHTSLGNDCKALYPFVGRTLKVFAR